MVAQSGNILKKAENRMACELALGKGATKPNSAVPGGGAVLPSPSTRFGMGGDRGTEIPGPLCQVCSMPRPRCEGGRAEARAPGEVTSIGPGDREWNHSLHSRCLQTPCQLVHTASQLNLNSSSSLVSQVRKLQVTKVR